MINRYAIIMAGGVGSRFWPLSRYKKPKQFLDILGSGETLLQQTFKRFKNICAPDNIFVVTNSDHRQLVLDQLEIRPERILSEPFRRNTTSCIAYGTYVILRENPDALIAITPADHVIAREEAFQKIIVQGFDFASSHNALITIGITPDKPDTGYGYIRSDHKEPVKGFKNLFKVIEFIEKPERSVAETFLKSGDYYWNAGIFVWSTRSITEALEQFLPDICASFNEGLSLLGTSNENDFIKKIYYTFPNISIDYSILEKASNVYVLGSDMGWSDLGTWSSLYSHSEIDNNNNAVVSGSAFLHSGTGNLVSIPEGKVALIEGLEDYIVVDTPDALLIVRKKEEQKIKQYLEEISLNINVKIP